MQKILEALQRDVIDLKTQLARRQPNVSIGNMNNTISINNTNHTHTMHVHVYPYGRIPRSVWPEKARVQHMFKEPRTCIPKYLKAKYFERPETKCFKLPNAASQRVNVKVDDSNWTSRGKKCFVATLVEDGLQELLNDPEYNGKSFPSLGKFSNYVKAMNNILHYKPPPPHRAQAESDVEKMLVDGQTEEFVNTNDMNRWEEDEGLSWGDD